MMSQEPFTFLDLFCGCGGFTLGMERAGFRCLAAIDFNPEAVAVFKKNFPHVPLVLERDLTRFEPPRRLYPDSALEHGTRISRKVEDYPPVSRFEPRLLKPFFEQSGWPVVLVTLVTKMVENFALN